MITQGKKQARYVELHLSGGLRKRADEALEILRECSLCPRSCGADRTQDEEGVCSTGRLARVASKGPHFGEESVLVGSRGSGTVFFSGCNLNCVFCQNHDISQGPGGRKVEAAGLASMFMDVQNAGCHNLNLVTPTHVMPQILEALDLAAAQGLEIPVVWNSGGYESVKALKLLDGVVDIYMPDFKFTDKEPAARFCDAPDYAQHAKAALKEMHRQVGDLEVDENGIALKGLLVRHLVMPDGFAGSMEAIRFLSQEISPDTFINIMDQYRPCFEARSHQDINRYPEDRLIIEAKEAARLAGLRLDGEGAFARGIRRLFIL